jgi:predicted transcriptional regulator
MAAVTTTYTAVANREGEWWVLAVPDLDIVTQARRLDQAEPMVRDLIATWLDIPADSFRVSVTADLPDDVRADVAEARQLRQRAEVLTMTAAAASRRVVERLIGRGLRVRDVALILGISPQRVSQLSSPARGNGQGKAVAAKRSSGKAVAASKSTGKTVAARNSTGKAVAAKKSTTKAGVAKKTAAKAAARTASAGRRRTPGR